MKLKHKVAFAALSLVFAGSAAAGDYAPAPPMQDKVPMDKQVVIEEADCRDYVKTLDRIWAFPTLYKNKENPYIQEFSIIGRIQYQGGKTWSDQGDEGFDQFRRTRIGAQLKFLNFFKLKGEINMDWNDADPFYDSIDELYLSAEPSDFFGIAVGKQKVKFSYEESTSSKEIKTIERSLIVNTLAPGKHTGAQIYGEAGPFEWYGGVWAGDDRDEFSQFDAGAVALASVGYHFPIEALDDVFLRFDYMYNFDQDDNDAFADYEHFFAANLFLAKDRFEFVGQGLGAINSERGDIWGVTAMPTYVFLKDTCLGDFELVYRFQYTEGDNDTVRAQSRYERIVPNISDGGRGDEYWAHYVGLNWYIYGHKLKLMTGIEWFDLDDNSGDGGDVEGHTFFAGVRMYW